MKNLHHLELSEADLSRVRGGDGKEIVFTEGRLAQMDIWGPGEQVCYPEPNMSTPEGPVYVP